MDDALEVYNSDGVMDIFGLNANPSTLTNSVHVPTRRGSFQTQYEQVSIKQILGRMRESSIAQKNTRRSGPLDEANSAKPIAHVIEVPCTGIANRDEYICPLYLPSHCEKESETVRVMDDELDTYNASISINEMGVVRRQIYCRNRDVSETEESQKSASKGSQAGWGLKFESDFECGNLYKAEAVIRKSALLGAPEEYDLYVEDDPVKVLRQSDQKNKPTNEEANSTQTIKPHNQWFFFQVMGTKKRTYRFNIRNLTESKSNYEKGMKPVFISKIDFESSGKGWRRVNSDVSYMKNVKRRQRPSNKALDTLNMSFMEERFTLSFTLDCPHAKDTLYIAYSVPYTRTQLDNMIYYLSRTPALNKNIKTNTLCRTAAGNSCLVLEITEKREYTLEQIDGIANKTTNNYTGDQSSKINGNGQPPSSTEKTETETSDSEIAVPKFLAKLQRQMKSEVETIEKQRLRNRHKPIVVITSRSHGSDTASSYVCEGIINYLLGSNTVAKNLRKKLLFVIVPMLNPDGVINGMHKTNLLAYDIKNHAQKPKSNRQATIYYLKQYLQELAKSHRFAAYLDLEDSSNKEGVFFLGLPLVPKQEKSVETTIVRASESGSENKSVDSRSMLFLDVIKAPKVNAVTLMQLHAKVFALKKDTTPKKLELNILQKIALQENDASKIGTVEDPRLYYFYAAKNLGENISLSNCCFPTTHNFNNENSKNLSLRVVLAREFFIPMSVSAVFSQVKFRKYGRDSINEVFTSRDFLKVGCLLIRSLAECYNMRDDDMGKVDRRQSKDTVKHSLASDSTTLDGLAVERVALINYDSDSDASDTTIHSNTHTQHSKGMFGKGASISLMSGKEMQELGELWEIESEVSDGEIDIDDDENEDDSINSSTIKKQSKPLINSSIIKAVPQSKATVKAAISSAIDAVLLLEAQTSTADDLGENSLKRAGSIAMDMDETSLNENSIGEDSTFSLPTSRPIATHPQSSHHPFQQHSEVAVNKVSGEDIESATSVAETVPLKNGNRRYSSLTLREPNRRGSSLSVEEAHLTVIKQHPVLPSFKTILVYDGVVSSLSTPFDVFKETFLKKKLRDSQLITSQDQILQPDSLLKQEKSGYSKNLYSDKRSDYIGPSYAELLSQNTSLFDQNSVNTFAMPRIQIPTPKEPDLEKSRPLALHKKGIIKIQFARSPRKDSLQGKALGKDPGIVSFHVDVPFSQDRNVTIDCLSDDETDIDSTKRSTLNFSSTRKPLPPSNNPRSNRRHTLDTHRNVSRSDEARLRSRSVKPNASGSPVSKQSRSLSIDRRSSKEHDDHEKKRASIDSEQALLISTSNEKFTQQQPTKLSTISKDKKSQVLIDDSTVESFTDSIVESSKEQIFHVSNKQECFTVDPIDEIYQGSATSTPNAKNAVQTNQSFTGSIIESEPMSFADEEDYATEKEEEIVEIGHHTIVQKLTSMFETISAKLISTDSALNYDLRATTPRAIIPPITDEMPYDLQYFLSDEPEKLEDCKDGMEQHLRRKLRIGNNRVALKPTSFLPENLPEHRDDSPTREPITDSLSRESTIHSPAATKKLVRIKQDQISTAEIAPIKHGHYDAIKNKFTFDEGKLEDRVEELQRQFLSDIGLKYEAIFGNKSLLLSAGQSPQRSNNHSRERRESILKKARLAELIEQSSVLGHYGNIGLPTTATQDKYFSKGFPKRKVVFNDDVAEALDPEKDLNTPTFLQDSGITVKGVSGIQQLHEDSLLLKYHMDNYFDHMINSLYERRIVDESLTEITADRILKIVRRIQVGTLQNSRRSNRRRRTRTLCDFPPSGYHTSGRMYNSSANRARSANATSKVSSLAIRTLTGYTRYDDGVRVTNFKLDRETKSPQPLSDSLNNNNWNWLTSLQGDAGELKSKENIFDVVREVVEGMVNDVVSAESYYQENQFEDSIDTSCSAKAYHYLPSSANTDRPKSNQLARLISVEYHPIVETQRPETEHKDSEWYVRAIHSPHHLGTDFEDNNKGAEGHGMWTTTTIYKNEKQGSPRKLQMPKVVGLEAFSERKREMERSKVGLRYPVRNISLRISKESTKGEESDGNSRSSNRGVTKGVADAERWKILTSDSPAVHEYLKKNEVIHRHRTVVDAELGIGSSMVDAFFINREVLANREQCEMSENSEDVDMMTKYINIYKKNIGTGFDSKLKLSLNSGSAILHDSASVSHRVYSEKASKINRFEKTTDNVDEGPGKTKMISLLAATAAAAVEKISTRQKKKKASMIVHVPPASSISATKEATAPSQSNNNSRPSTANSKQVPHSKQSTPAEGGVSSMSTNSPRVGIHLSRPASPVKTVTFNFENPKEPVIKQMSSRDSFSKKRRVVTKK